MKRVLSFFFQPSIRALLALLLLGGIILLANPLQSLPLLLEAGPVLLLWLAVGFGGIILTNALAVWWVLRTMKNIPLKRVLLNYTYSWSTEFYFPGKLGMFSLAYFLQKEKVEVGESVASILLIKMTMLVWLFLLSLLAIGSLLTTNDFLIYSGTLIAVVGGLSFLFLTERGRHFIRYGVLGKHAVHFIGFSRLVKTMLGDPMKWIGLFFLVFLSIFINGIMVQGLFAEVGYSLDLLTVLGVVSSTILVGLIPISLNGLGVKEGALIVFMGLHGIPTEIAASVGLLSTTTGYVLSLLIMALVLKEIPSTIWKGGIPHAGRPA
ncbi:MAG: lysylphosphatidylglycerol synthase domain-containing protein [archaeon]